MKIVDVNFTGLAKLGCWGPGDPEGLIGKFYVYREGRLVGDDSSFPARTFYLQRNGHWRLHNDDGTFSGMDEAEKARKAASDTAE